MYHLLGAHTDLGGKIKFFWLPSGVSLVFGGVPDELGSQIVREYHISIIFWPISVARDTRDQAIPFWAKITYFSAIFTQIGVTWWGQKSWFFTQIIMPLSWYGHWLPIKNWQIVRKSWVKDSGQNGLKKTVRLSKGICKRCISKPIIWKGCWDW